MTLKIKLALIVLLLFCTALHAAEGDIPRFDYGLEEGVQTVPPLTHALVGPKKLVLDDNNLPYGTNLAADLAAKGDPATFYNASVVKVGSNYYIWAHQGWLEAGCADTPDSRDQSGDNVVIYKSPHPDVIWSTTQGTDNGFYPKGCSSATCNGAIQRGELLRSLGTDYKTNDVCPTKNATGMGSIARIGTTSSYVVFFDNTDDDLHQIDPMTGQAVWLPGRDLECSSSCFDKQGQFTHCPGCEGGQQFEPQCSNSNNIDPYFSHWALWRPLFNIGNGTSFDGVERVAFNGRGIDRVFIDPVPFTIPGDNGTVGFLVRSAKAGWCENFRDTQLHYGYVTTGATPKVFLLMPNNQYSNVTGSLLSQIPKNVDPTNGSTPKINDVEAVTTNGANAFVAYEAVVLNGKAGNCGGLGIGRNGPIPQGSTETPIHTEMRYRAFKLNGRQWGGWASTDAVDLGSKPAGTALWNIDPFSRDGQIGANFPDVLRDGATTRLYYTQDTDCTGTFLKDDIAHVELRTNIAWDSGFRESQATTAPIVFYPQDFGVTYPNSGVQPNAVFIGFGSLGGIFGSTVDTTDRKWTVMNAAMASSRGGSFSCVHGWKNEKLLRIVVALTGAVPGASYDVYVDYMVDGSLANGLDGLLARLGGGTIYEFSDSVAGLNNQYTTIERAEPSTLEIRRALLGTKAASSTGQIGNIHIDNEFTSATPRFEISRFCGLYVERR